MVMAMSNEVILLNKILDASANTIWDELKKIRESSDLEKKIIRRRWIWELIQNASDCTPKGGKIDIKIEYNNKKIIRRRWIWELIQNASDRKSVV